MLFFFEKISKLSLYHRRVQRNFCLLNLEDRIRAELRIYSVKELQYSSFTLKIVTYCRLFFTHHFYLHVVQLS